MDRELAGALADLGLSATEAAVYAALLRSAASGPVTAYRLAQEMGRDPANLTKVLAAMCKRGAVRVSGRRPRLYAPTAPEDFTDRMIARLQDRRKRALELLRAIGDPPPGPGPHPLRSRREAMASARLLIQRARRIVLIDGSGDFLDGLKDVLGKAAAEQGAMVLVLGAGSFEVPGIRIVSTDQAASLAGRAPGPWLRLSVDGEACLEILAHHADEDALICGHWSCSEALAFATHRSLADAVILADLQEQLRRGVDGTLACRKAAELAGVLHGETAREAAAEAAAAEPDGSLQFVFRRRKI